MFTDADKLACIGRELALRHRVYADRIRRGVMMPAQAEREIALMEAIYADYLVKVEPELVLDGA